MKARVLVKLAGFAVLLTACGSQPPLAIPESATPQHLVTIESQCSRATTPELLRIYGSGTKAGATLVLKAKIDSFDGTTTLKKTVDGTEVVEVYTRISLSSVDGLYGDPSKVPTEAWILGGSADQFKVIGPSFNGVSPGSDAMLILYSEAGLGLRVSNSFAMDGDSVILDGKCQQPGTLAHKPFGGEISVFSGGTAGRIQVDDGSSVALDAFARALN